MNNKEINYAVAEVMAGAGKFICSRCPRTATIVKYGAPFCSDLCAELASDYTLEEGHGMIPDYCHDLNAMKAVYDWLKTNKHLAFEKLGDALEKLVKGPIWNATAKERALAFLKEMADDWMAGK